MKPYLLMSVFFALLLACPWALKGQNCDNCRYLSYQFDSVQVSLEQFGEGVNADRQTQQLFMDIYEPYGDTVGNRPLVIFAFGGGFIQGSRDENYVVNACRRFARAGYVAAAIDYRIGFDVLGLFPNPTEELMRVFFRAMQDMRGAVQWFRADADQYGNNYRIDPNRVYVGGASAGAITAIMMTYCDDSTEFEEIGSLGAIDQLGGFYSSSGLRQGYSWEPQGVLNIAGAIVNTEWMKQGDPPILNTHGDQDAVVPYQGGNIDFGFTSIGLEGSYNINQRADSVGVCSYLYTIVGGDHPSGNAPVTYFDEIYLRLLPRMHALVNGRTFCCPLALDLEPENLANIILEDPLPLQFTLSNDNGNAQSFYCGSSCSPDNGDIWDDILANLGDDPYYLIGIATEGNCQATDFSYLEVGISRDEAAPDSWFADFTVSPNPALAQVTVTLEERVRGEVKVVLRDLQGRKLQEQSSMGKEIRLLTADFPPGAYILEVWNKGKVGKQKIILQ